MAIDTEKPGQQFAEWFNKKAPDGSFPHRLYRKNGRRVDLGAEELYAWIYENRAHLSSVLTDQPEQEKSSDGPK